MWSMQEAITNTFLLHTNLIRVRSLCIQHVRHWQVKILTIGYLFDYIMYIYMCFKKKKNWYFLCLKLKSNKTGKPEVMKSFEYKPLWSQDIQVIFYPTVQAHNSLGSYHFLPGWGAVCFWGDQNFLGWSKRDQYLSNTKGVLMECHPVDSETLDIRPWISCLIYTLQAGPFSISNQSTSWHLSVKSEHYEQNSQQIIEACHVATVTSSEEGEPILLDPDPTKCWQDICTVPLGP